MVNQYINEVFEYQKSDKFDNHFVNGLFIMAVYYNTNIILQDFYK